MNAWGRVVSLGIALALGGCAVPSDDDADVGEGASAASRAARPAWSREADMPAAMTERYLPWFEARARWGELEGERGITIRYATLRAERERGAIVVFNGRAEAIRKYAEVAYDLVNAGFSLYLFDHRGQGFSERLLGDAQKGHVDDFDAYVKDAKTFHDRVVRPGRHAKVFALAHSMGGAILANYVARYPADFRAAAFSAPMFRVKYPWWAGGEPAGEVGAAFIAGIGDETSYAPTQGPYVHGAENIFSTSAARFAATDGINVRWPGAALGGATKKWIVESIEGARAARRLAEEGKLTTPMILLQAGADRLVEDEAQDDVCKAARSCRRVPFPGAGHELLMERDRFRDGALDAIYDFFVAQ